MLAGDFALRRQRLLDLLPAGSKVIVYGRELLRRLPTVPIAFHQFSDFLYLTGEPRPGGALVIENRNGRAYSTLFLPQPDRETELWEGFRTRFEEGQKRSGVEAVMPVSEFDHWVEMNTPDSNQVFCSFPPHQSCHKTFKQLSTYIDRLRVVKSDKELELMRKACKISVNAIQIAMKKARAGMRECEVAARFELEAFERGATGLAYPIECQSGANALCLHYIENRSVIKEGDGLLMDAGCEYEHYASDFTRTVAIGETKAIRRDAIHMVDEMRKELVRMAKNGEVSTLNQLNEKCQSLSIARLKELGIRVDANTVSSFCPHRVSHWIGLDVHDAGTVGMDTQLKKGHVFSVEPGMYFQMDLNCPSELKGLGIRSEDTVILE